MYKPGTLHKAERFTKTKKGRIIGACELRVKEGLRPLFKKHGVRISAVGVEFKRRSKGLVSSTEISISINLDKDAEYKGEQPAGFFKYKEDALGFQAIAKRIMWDAVKGYTTKHDTVRWVIPGFIGPGSVGPTPAGFKLWFGTSDPKPKPYEPPRPSNGVAKLPLPSLLF